MKHLVLGGGSIGRRHLKNLSLIGQRDLFCYKRSYDNDFEKEFHCTVITSIEEMKVIKPDILYICTPTSLHYQGLDWAKEFGAHVFMEKPFVHNEQLLQKAIQQWKSDRVFFIGFVLRFHPLLKVIRELLIENIIGEVYSARFEFGSYLPNWHTGVKPTEGYAGNRSLGGGVINTITHELDLMLSLFGNPDSVISAKVNLDHLNIDVEELAESIFRYKWGLVTLHLDFLQKDYDRSIRILGTEGKITCNWIDSQVVIKKFKEQKETLEIKVPDFNELYIDELKNFLDLVRLNEINHPLDFDYAVTNTQWMLLMHKSAETEILWEK